MVKHIVMFSLEGPQNEVAAAAAKFKTAIEALPAAMPQWLHKAEVGINDGPAAGNWTLVLTADCPDYESLAAYSAADAHLACVAIIKPLLRSRACVDYTV